MKKVLNILLTVVIIAGAFWLLRPAFIDEFIYKAPPNIKYTKALDYVGEEIVTKGTVENANYVDDAYVLLIGENSVKGVLVVIPEDHVDNVKLPKAGDKIKVKGQVFEDQGDGKTTMAAIEVDDNEQIDFIE